MDKIKEVFKVLRTNNNENNKRQLYKNLAMSVIVCISAGIMLVMNILKHSTMMTVTSLILVAGFTLTGIIAGVFKKTNLSSVLMALILTGVFTVFPISGGNEGFAVLWVLLIPLFSISLFGLRIGICMNLYFMLLVLILFYTPVSAQISDLYTENFMQRFPVLFFADSVTAQFIAMSMEYYYNLTRRQVYTDDMTGVYNRKYFIETIEKTDILKDDLCISVIDVNGLKEINDTLGHLAGDEMISSVPAFAKEAFGSEAVIARLGGDEFGIITYGGRDAIEQKVSAMKTAAAEHKGDQVNAVYISVGIACRSEFSDMSAEELFQAADKAMYQDKSAYYRQKGHDRRRR